MSAECSIIERHKIVKIVCKILQILKISLNFQIRVYFSVYRVGPVF